MANEFQQLYKNKLMPASEAVALIPSGAKICTPITIAAPPAILQAIADRAEAREVDNLHFYYLLQNAIAGNTIMRPELSDRIHLHSFFHGAFDRKLNEGRVAAGLPQIDYIPSAFSRVPHIMMDVIKVDTLITTVSPMDEDGYFTFGTSVEYVGPVSSMAKLIILEVNKQMPKTFGPHNKIHISKVAALVEHDAPILELPIAAPSEIDNKISEIIAGFIKDGDCLQMGIGTLPDAVCNMLVNHKHLGVHTELLISGLIRLIKCGAVDNSKKTINQGISTYAFAMGTKDVYDYIDNNPKLEAYPVNYINEPCVISKNDNMVSVNATLEVDLNGACNSEFMNGHQFSASGGQLDFVRGAGLSKNGRSIITCQSTAAKGTISRIVPKLSGPVTTPRNDTHIIITEYGYADLRGKDLGERARALIAIAHPKFREELERYAKESHYF